MRGGSESGRHLGTIGGWTRIRCGLTDHHKSGYLSADYLSAGYLSHLDYGPLGYHGGPSAHRRRRGRGVDLRPRPVQRL